MPLTGADGSTIATLLVPRDVPAETIERLRSQVAPALAALVAVALHRDAVQAEAVETAALRRSDELKTALLRAVSHDLRTPLTAIVTAGHALGSSSLTGEEREQMSAAVVEEGERLSALIDKLLDLSRLQAGRLEPRRESVSIEEVLLAAEDALPAAAGHVQACRRSRNAAAGRRRRPARARVREPDRERPALLRTTSRCGSACGSSDRAWSCASPIAARGSPTASRSASSSRSTVARTRSRRPGSGLGLAIAKGFVEANGGTIAVESLPGPGHEPRGELSGRRAQAPDGQDAVVPA